jgi:AraC-like DNA-binding protein
MGALFSTAGLQTGRQFQYFCEAICEAVIRLGARRSHGGPYDAEIRTFGLGPLELAEVQCDPVIIERTRGDIARDAAACYFFTLQLEGTGRVSQCGREALLQPGEFTLVDSTEPYVLSFETRVRRLVVRVPSDQLDRRTGAGVDLRAVAFARGRPGTGLVFNALRGLAEEARVHSSQADAALAACTLDLAVTAMLSRGGRQDAEYGAGRLRLLNAIRAYARANLRDPDLAPQGAAAAAGISVRYLHQLFQREGATFGAWVRDERLRRCHAEIGDPAQSWRSISDIAFGYGFNDMAHFSRLFARSFGYPPRELRLRALGKQRG